MGSSNKNNVGDALMGAIQDAIDSQDFSTLKGKVQTTFDQAVNDLNASLSQAMQNMGEQQKRNQERQQANMAAYQAQREKAAQQRQALQAKALEKRDSFIKRYQANNQAQQAQLAFSNSRYKPVVSQQVSGAVCAALGIGGLSLFGAALPVFLAGGFTFSAAASGLFAVIGAVMVGIGAGRIALASKFKKFQKIIGPREGISIQELAQQSGDSPKKTLRDVRDMIKRGYFLEATLVENDSYLIITEQGRQAYLKAQADYLEKRRKEAMIQSVTPHLDEPAPISPEAQAVLDRGNAFIAKIRAMNDAIPGAEVSHKIDQIESVVANIFQRAHDHPEIIPDLQQLMDYYLPTTVKLLEAYYDLDRQPFQSDTITASKKEIEDTLDTLNVAFEKLLDSVFQDMTWDVSTDISVLHTVLAQEGLVDDPFAPTRKD